MSKQIKFKTETKRLLDLMINSIYTNKDIFLRELISNASDAMDKRHFLSLTNSKVENVEYQIVIEANKEERKLTILDNGIGFTYDQLVSHLGTIAKSGSKEFLESIEEDVNKSEVDIIGQFGVGFYSAFMVAKEIEVITKSPLSETGYIFKSEGLESYSIDETSLEIDGTKIVLYLRDNEEDLDYDKYLDEYTIKDLIKKYSDYVHYPIKTWVTKFNNEGEENEEETLELETVNSMIPIWKKNKNEVDDEQLNSFYKQKFMDYQDPIASMFFTIEGNVEYNSLIFIPRKPAFIMNDEVNEKGLQLYTKGVFILEKCKELIPDYLKFVKGLVDSSDLSLNISREMLQEDRTLGKIASSLEKKILSELTKMQKNEREKYQEFYNTYGIHLKFGAYEEYGAKKDSLKDLLMFESLNSDSMITLKEYVENMKENQKEIYYASGKDKESVLKLPQMDLVKKQEYDVLVFKDDVDEFLINVLKEYDSKSFKSINQGDLNLISEEEAKKIDEIKEEKKDLIEALKESLKDEVVDVVISKRLSDSPVCIVSKDGISFEMEKVLTAQHGHSMKAQKILEINPNHTVFKAIEKVYENNPNKIGQYASLLYGQALLIEGLPLNDAVEFANTMCELMVEASK